MGREHGAIKQDGNSTHGSNKKGTRMPKYDK